MLADDFSCLIAFDALGTGVPAGDDTVGIDHVDRIIGDAIDQQPELPLAFAQCFLRCSPLGDVARYFRIAEKVSVIVPDCVYDNAGPVVGVVLALTSPLAFEMSFTFRGCQGLSRQAECAVLFGVKGAEMPADDLLTRVSRDPLGARVPTGDVSFRIQRADCVVRHALDELTESALFRDFGRRGAGVGVAFRGHVLRFVHRVEMTSNLRYHGRNTSVQAPEGPAQQFQEGDLDPWTI